MEMARETEEIEMNQKENQKRGEDDPRKKGGGAKSEAG
jgi:hypothetical protein